MRVGGVDGEGWVKLRENGSRFRANAHLSRDEAAAKMGHPDLWLLVGLEAHAVVGGGAVEGGDGQVVEAEVDA